MRTGNAMQPPRPEQIKYRPSFDFVLVYQSGNTNEYCDENRHIITTGGYTQLSDQRFKRVSACDCAKFGKKPMVRK